MNSGSNLDLHSRGELSQLQERLLTMGGEAEEQVRASIRALVERDSGLAEKVLVSDDSINNFHVEIDGRCFKLLGEAGFDPDDLRLIVSGLKINSDLERIGDIAINIAEATLRYLERPAVKPLIDIPRMAELAQSMLKDSLNAYVRRDVTLAWEVVKRDKEVDALKDQVFRELLSYMLANPATTEGALGLILISRHIERIGDHATNIAEDVIFLVSGQDVRHHGQEE